MRVKLCARCPYTPRDLASHYDPDAALHACAKCDDNYDMCDRQALSPPSPKEATMRNDPQHCRNGAAKRCASCDGKFGLIRYYCWRTPLCSKACVGRFRARQESDRRWLIRFRAA
jgi:hypothetical protein